MWNSLNRRVDLHTVDATPSRWRAPDALVDFHTAADGQGPEELPLAHAEDEGRFLQHHTLVAAELPSLLMEARIIKRAVPRWCNSGQLLFIPSLEPAHPSCKGQVGHGHALWSARRAAREEHVDAVLR